MSKVRLREPSQAEGAEGNGTTPAGSIQLRPIKVAGIVIRKRDLLEALRPYVHAVDVQTTEDGEFFWLVLPEEEDREDTSAR